LKSKRLFPVLALLIGITCILSAFHLSHQPDVQPGSFRLSVSGSERTVSFSSLPMDPVTGTIVNGKGDFSEIDATGISVAKLMAHIGAELPAETTVRVLAADQYSAEILLSEPAFLIPEDNGSLRLIVFGDENSARNVRNVVLLEVS